MAPLYKRYIPPKAEKPAAPLRAPSPLRPSPPPPRETSTAPEPAQNGELPKRKRTRTDDEVAERKAKKLRKKVIDPSTVELTPAAVAEPSVAPAAQTNPEIATSQNAAPSATGNFAHVKDTKKRHRLEKEARKARIAAEKQAKADAANGNGERLGDEQDTAKAHGTSSLVREAVKDNESDSDEKSQEAALTKRKERRKGEEQEADTACGDESQTLEDNETRQDADRNTYDERLSQPKKRRHKLEGVLEELADQQEPEDEDDEHLRKHGSILNKFQKAQKVAASASSRPENQAPQDPPPELHDLVPLPQPERAPTPDFVPDPNVLPTWLAKPTIVADDTKQPFVDLGFQPRLAQHIAKLGFNDALPVQQALIPLLLPPGTPGARFLPGSESVLPDVAVGAATGSGKTIAYLLPIIEDLKKHAGSGKLRGVVVVPTRELVMQIAAVAESLAKGSKIKVGVATGTGSFADEQARIVQRSRRYDRELYENLIAKAHRLQYPSTEASVNIDSGPDSYNFDDYLDEIEGLNAKEQQLLWDTVSELDGHVPVYDSAVDMLIATPGRLLEHLESTLGFSLAQLSWLVLDEADKLLDGQYSNFLQTITPELERARSEEEQDARERYLRAVGRWNEDRERRIRKVVLSATMTRDISKLMELRLKRAQMVLVRSKNDASQPGLAETGEDSSTFELPPTLKEYSVHVGDGGEKPLFLIRILKEYILRGSDFEKPATRRQSIEAGIEADPEYSSDSSDSNSSDSDSDTGDSSSDESSATSSSVNEDRPADTTTAIHPSRAAALEHYSTAPTALIFTSSTESAARLSHLLTALLPSLAPQILTLTSTTTSKALNRRLAGIAPSAALLAITTDRAARGLDALGARPVTHVLQYDVPRSATGYVHRVGRTARAGRAGEAWTLFTHVEAKWLVHEVVRNAGLKRVGTVEKVKVGRVEEAAERERFEAAVEGLREGVLGSKKKR